MKQHMDYDWYSNDHLLWAFAIGIPILVVWVIGMPLIALVILIKYRTMLETVIIKKYLLLLYQGLKPNWFYWEFINTLRKFLVLLCIVFSTSLSINYRIMLGTIIIFIILRIQIGIQPYKDAQNNRIEILSTIASMITLFWGILFIEADEDIEFFKIIISILMFMFNILFILHWTFLFMVSWNIKNQTFNKFLSVYGMLICRKSDFSVNCNPQMNKKGKWKV